MVDYSVCTTIGRDSRIALDEHGRESLSDIDFDHSHEIGRGQSLSLHKSGGVSAVVDMVLIARRSERNRNLSTLKSVR